MERISTTLSGREAKTNRKSGDYVDFRSYRHIFTDANQSSPADDIKLGFQSRYREEQFEPGEYTYFHFPLVQRDFKYADTDVRATSGISIHKSGLVEDGAICGKAPYCADRVYANNGDYEWKDAMGGYSPRKLNNGVWLCAWLSGEIAHPEEAVWMDRWYDPEIVTKVESLRDGTTPGVYDVPSRLVFRYGAQYKYYRTSKEDIRKFVGDYDDGLLVWIDDWSLDGCKNKAPATSAFSVVKNNGCTSAMFDACEIVQHSGDYGIWFDGHSTVQIDTNKANSQSNDEFTAVAFIRHDDWKNAQGCGIIDRGYHGGWEMAFTSTPKNNLICVIGREKDEGLGSISVYGPGFNLVSHSTYDLSKPVYKALVDDEYYIWVIRDNGISKTDLNGNFIYTVEFPEELSGAGSEIIDFQMLGGDLYGLSVFTILNKETKEKDFYYLDMVNCSISKGGSESLSGLNTVISSPDSWLEEERGQFRIRSASAIINDYTGEHTLELDDDEEAISVQVDSDGNIYAMTKILAIDESDADPEEFKTIPFYQYQPIERTPSADYAIWNNRTPNAYSAMSVTTAHKYDWMSAEVYEPYPRLLPPQPAFYVSDTRITGTTELHRYMDAESRAFFLETNMDAIPSAAEVLYGTEIKDPRFYTPLSTEVKDAVPVYRLKHFDMDKHYYTTDLKDAQNLCKSREGDPIQLDNTITVDVMSAMLNYENPSAGWICKVSDIDHQFLCVGTYKSIEYDEKVFGNWEPVEEHPELDTRKFRWSFQGIAFYAWNYEADKREAKKKVVGGRLLRYIKDRDGTFYRRDAIDLPVSDYSQPAGMILSTCYSGGKIMTVVNAVMTDGHVTRYSNRLRRMWTTNISYYSHDIVSMSNGYEWGRRFCNNVIYAKATFGPTEEIMLTGGKKILMTYSMKNLSNRDWHQIALVREKPRDNDINNHGNIRFVVDCDTKGIYKFSKNEENWYIMSIGGPNIFLGGECGLGAQLYSEHHMGNMFWDGMMDDFRLYGIPLSDNDLSYIHMMKYDVQTMHWNMEIYDKYHIEAVRRFYKMKMPGSKSQNYDVVVNGYSPSGDEPEEFSSVKSSLSEMIKDSLPHVSPVYAHNRRVIFNGKNTKAKWK